MQFWGIISITLQHQNIAGSRYLSRLARTTYKHAIEKIETHISPFGHVVPSIMPNCKNTTLLIMCKLITIYRENGQSFNIERKL